MAVVLIEGHEIHRHVAVYDLRREVGYISYTKGSCQSCGRWRCLWWGRVFDDAMCSGRKHGEAMKERKKEKRLLQLGKEHESSR